MKTSFILAALIATSAIAFVPSASADQNVCVPGQNTCVSTYSDANGDCTTGNSWQSQQAYFYSYGAAGYYSAGAYNGCYNYEFFGITITGSYLGADVFTFGGPAGYGYAYAQWFSQSFDGDTYCDMYAYAYTQNTGGSGTGPLGCPAGAPPVLPQLLP